MRRSLEERFWGKVAKGQPDECWLWTASAMIEGYGQLRLTARDPIKTALAHRISFYLEHGFLPEVVMHTCDNPLCVNPRHLRGGTQKDNVKDMLDKGRTPERRGESNPYSVIKKDQVISMRNRFDEGVRVCDVAREASVNYQTAWNICNRVNWSHLL